jgi:hypothetical protein
MTRPSVPLSDMPKHLAHPTLCVAENRGSQMEHFPAMRVIARRTGRQLLSSSTAYRFTASIRRQRQRRRRSGVNCC